MTNTYAFSLQCDPIVVPSEDGLTNVVKTVHWRYMAADGQTPPTAVTRAICTQMGSPSHASFTDYSQVTLTMIEQWVIAEETANNPTYLTDMQRDMDAEIAALTDPNRPRPMPLMA